MNKLVLTLILFCVSFLYAQKEGDVIISEIGNNGTKKALYTGGDYVELNILSDAGVKLAGWFLTDLSSPNGSLMKSQGWVKFSDAEKSVFNKVLPKGTVVVVCFGTKDERFGPAELAEDVNTDDGNNKIVVFTEDSKEHLALPDSGKFTLTGKDNVALVSKWEKNAGIDCVSWGREISWTGAAVTKYEEGAVDNGKILYLKGNDADNTDIAKWVITTDTKLSSPGTTNPTK